MPSIAIIIPTLNEERYLPLLLNQITSQTKQPDEVIIADCASQDGTIAVAEKFSKRLPLKIAHSKIQTPAAARNAGSKLAKSDYLLFIDADSGIPKDAVARMVEAISSRPVDFVGVSFISDGRHWIDVTLTRLVRLKMYISMNITKKLWTIGGVMCVKATMHRKVGGFDEALSAHDDTDYARRLRKAGASFIYLRNLRTVTSSRRWQGNRFLYNLGHVLVYNSSLTKWALHPLTKKIGRERKYGHYK